LQPAHQTGSRAGRHRARRLLDEAGRAAVELGAHADQKPSDAGARGSGARGACRDGSRGPVSAEPGNAGATGVRAVVEVLARALADRPDAVRVTESQHKHMTLIELFVSPQDLPKLIG